MTPQVVTNVRLDAEINDEVAEIATEWFEGNKSKTLRDIVYLGLQAWHEGLRPGCLITRIDASAWIDECIKTVRERWPDAEITMGLRESYPISDEPKDPYAEVIYRMYFKPRPDSQATVLMGMEGLPAESFIERIERVIDRL